MREISRQTDPQQMVQTYGKRMRQVIPSDGNLSLSRRGLGPGQVRITRSSRFTDSVDPWKHGDRLPLIEGGLLADLIYGNEPVVIDDLDVPPDDPAYDFLAGHRSLVAVPMFDGGESINMVILLRKRPHAFDREGLPEHVWLANLFGRATSTLVLGNQVREAYDAVDRELKAVADIQRSLLPADLPPIPGLDVAAFYQTSKRAGGDYYDFFKLPDGRWGIFVADVSGHGTPAAVLMAITHSIAHLFGDPKAPPGALLAFVNHRLAKAYTLNTGNFVTAFYGVWDPATRELAFATAGHPAPRLRTAEGSILPLDGGYGLPLGIVDDEVFPNNVRRLNPGDTLVLYTDGITEARNPRGTMYELESLDAALAACAGAGGDARAVLAGLLTHLHATGRHPAVTSLPTPPAPSPPAASRPARPPAPSSPNRTCRSSGRSRRASGPCRPA
jgi:sigma-B regulation protein RsbU (phosphoserine phosphatase)